TRKSTLPPRKSFRADQATRLRPGRVVALSDSGFAKNPTERQEGPTGCRTRSHNKLKVVTHRSTNLSARIKRVRGELIDVGLEIGLVRNVFEPTQRDRKH